MVRAVMDKPCVYILKNSKTDRFYIGSTTSLERRIKQHRLGYTRTTRVLGTHELVYIEEYDNLVDARLREKKLKSYKSKKYLHWLIDSAAR